MPGLSQEPGASSRSTLLRAPSTWAISYLSLRCTSRELDVGGAAKTQTGAHTGYWHCRWGLNLRRSADWRALYFIMRFGDSLWSKKLWAAFLVPLHFQQYILTSHWAAPPSLNSQLWVPVSVLKQSITHLQITKWLVLKLSPDMMRGAGFISTRKLWNVDQKSWFSNRVFYVRPLYQEIKIHFSPLVNIFKNIEHPLDAKENFFLLLTMHGLGVCVSSMIQWAESICIKAHSSWK